MPFEIQRTSNFSAKYNKLTLRFKRLVDQAVEIIKEFPTDYQNRITVLSQKKEGRLYRFRLPGCYLFYIVPQGENDDEVRASAGNAITLTELKLL